MCCNKSRCIHFRSAFKLFAQNLGATENSSHLTSLSIQMAAVHSVFLSLSRYILVFSHSRIGRCPADSESIVPIYYKASRLCVNLVHDPFACMHRLNHTHTDLERKLKKKSPTERIKWREKKN